MANFYTEVPELKFQLNNPMMERICELKERGYEDKDKFDYAPQDYSDAMDSYDKVLEITGEITGEIINPMPKAWTKKVPTVPTAAWNMPVVQDRIWMPW